MQNTINVYPVKNHPHFCALVEWNGVKQFITHGPSADERITDAISWIKCQKDAKNNAVRK